MILDLDFELPFHSEPPEPVLRMTAERYLEFIEFNQQIIRANGRMESVLSQRSCPVDRMFSLD